MVFFNVRVSYHECIAVQTVAVVLRQDIGIRFCDKVHLECERSTVQGLLLPTHQLWHRTK